MTYQEVGALIDSFGYPSAYSHFSSNTQLPPQFITWYYNGTDDVYADNLNYQTIRPLVIEFYSAYKDIAAETQIEHALNEAGLSYDKDDGFIESEKLFETIYNLEVVING